VSAPRVNFGERRSIRLNHHRFHRYQGPRPRRIDGIMTVPQVAQTIGVAADWIYNLIRRGVIEIDRDPATRLYHFPDRPETLHELQDLKNGLIHKLSYRRRHQDA
jgi:predicted DNA-binding transcriptional regulator AlpA